MSNHPNWKKIILIDDDIILNLIHKKILEILRFEGEILDFNNGFQAIKYIRNEVRIDYEKNVPSFLIILDIEMPGLNGWEFLKSFGRLDPQVKSQFGIIVSSSSTDPQDFKQAFEYEMVNDYIPKPLTIEIIRGLVLGRK
jgi:CheY-like chemotaxis protein